MAADAYSMGMDGSALLDEVDPFRYNVLATIVKIGQERMEMRERRLAAYTAEEVIKRIK